MVWFILLGALAAFGLLCCVYIAAGFFLSDDRRVLLVCLLPEGHYPDGAIARFRWLHGLGLVRGPLLILGSESLPLGQNVEYCTVQELPVRLELERNQLD